MFKSRHICVLTLVPSFEMVPPSVSFPVSELQEEGINAINLPLSPSHYELDPEDTMLGELSPALLETTEMKTPDFHVFSLFPTVKPSLFKANLYVVVMPFLCF